MNHVPRVVSVFFLCCWHTRKVDQRYKPTSNMYAVDVLFPLSLVSLTATWTLILMHSPFHLWGWGGEREKYITCQFACDHMRPDQGSCAWPVQRSHPPKRERERVPLFIWATVHGPKSIYSLSFSFPVLGRRKVHMSSESFCGKTSTCMLVPIPFCSLTHVCGWWSPQHNKYGYDCFCYIILCQNHVDVARLVIGSRVRGL